MEMNNMDKLKDIKKEILNHCGNLEFEFSVNADRLLAYYHRGENETHELCLIVDDDCFKDEQLEDLLDKKRIKFLSYRHFKHKDVVFNIVYRMVDEVALN